MTNRRKFMLQIGLGSAAAVLAARAMADNTAVAETDPLPASMGYKADGTKADKAKFPRYAAGQQCGNCALYQGKPGDKTGPCLLFGGKQVTAVGWCNSWAKKA